jgi:putative acetyltransferase
MIIRDEEKTDNIAVRKVNVSAFETPAEANLVDTLREHAQSVISMVAEENGSIVGHIMFSPVHLSGDPELKVMGLGPMAVIPQYQNKGIGSALVKTGLNKCKELGVVAVVVLGHPHFYPRFGFSPSLDFGIDSEYDVPAEVFMALELYPNSLYGKTGRVKYHSAFRNG